MHSDVRGLPVTASSEEAVERLDATLASFLRFSLDTGDRLKATLESDPECPLAHCLRGCFMLLFAQPRLSERAGKSLALAREAAAAHGASKREQAHIEALALWVDGDMTGAAERWEALLLEQPLDLMALKMAHYLHFYHGDPQRLRDSTARVRHAWDESVSGYSYLLGMHAFGLEESGAYNQAENAGRRAVGIEPRDPWAIHAIAHVLEMTDRRDEGISWLRSLQGHWSGCNNFAYHLWWHLSLFHLELDQHDEVLALYDERIRAEQTDEYLDISNATALLWRLQERGVDVGDRWTELGERCVERVGDQELVFADVHYALALAATGRSEQVQAMIEAARERPASTQAGLWDRFGVPVARAVDAWYRGEHGEVVEALMPVRYELAAIGGSHAQRDLFAQMLIASALASGRARLARALLSERTGARPDNAWSWQRYARALEMAGDEDAASDARERAEELPG